MQPVRSLLWLEEVAREADGNVSNLQKLDRASLPARTPPGAVSAPAQLIPPLPTSLNIHPSLPHRADCRAASSDRDSRACGVRSLAWVHGTPLESGARPSSLPERSRDDQVLKIPAPRGEARLVFLTNPLRRTFASGPARPKQNRAAHRPRGGKCWRRGTDRGGPVSSRDVRFQRRSARASLRGARSRGRGGRRG